MRSSIIVLLATLLLCTVSPSRTLADQPDPKLTRLLTLGLKDQRDRLIRGIYRAHGRLVDDNPETGHLEGAVDIFCAFDFQKDLFRFDRVEPCRSSPQLTPDDPPPQDENVWVKRETGGKFVRIPKYTLHVIHEAVNPTIEIKKNMEPPYNQIKPLDVRALCLVGYHGIDTPFSEAYKGWTLSQPSRITKEGEHVYHMVNNYEECEFNFWIDEQQGYSPVRYEVRERASSKGRMWRLAATCEMSSEQINGIWVPRSLVAVEYFPGDDVTRFEIAIDWESVNQNVSDTLFTPDGLDMPRGALVVNNKQGTPFVERVIGGGPARVGMAQQKQPPPPAVQRARPSLAWRLAPVALPLLILLVFVWFRFRANRAAGRDST